MMFTRLRWVTIIVPALFVIGVEALSDTYLDEALPFPVDAIIVAVAVIAAATIMSTLAFRQIDRLGRELTARNAELEARNAAARALHAMSMSIAALADLDKILSATTRNAQTLLSADVGLLVRGVGQEDEHLAATSGPAEAFDPTGAQPGDDARRFLRAPHSTYLAAPLQRGGETVGVLAVASHASRSHGVDDLATLSSLATQAAIAIENDRLQGELRTLAVSAERERIAREMHDGLAQVLGYVNTKSQAVEALLADGRNVEAQAQMGELATAARSMYVDVREAILGLSTPLSVGPAGSGLATAIDAYAHRFSDASKIAVHVETSTDGRVEEPSAEVVANVLRIVQEALTNVRKHAAAQRVVIRLDRRADGLEVVVEDDGRGFDPDAPAGPSDWPHFGQQTIRQRAAAIGGTATWDSTPGAGTRLRVVVPAAAGPAAAAQGGTRTGVSA
jgi:signal transduction histidine kinase